MSVWFDYVSTSNRNRTRVCFCTCTALLNHNNNKNRHNNRYNNKIGSTKVVHRVSQALGLINVELIHSLSLSAESHDALFVLSLVTCQAIDVQLCVQIFSYLVFLHIEPYNTLYTRATYRLALGFNVKFSSGLSWQSAKAQSQQFHCHTHVYYTHYTHTISSLLFHYSLKINVLAEHLLVLWNVYQTSTPRTGASPDLSSDLCGILRCVLYINLLPIHSECVWMFIPWRYLFIVGFLGCHYVGDRAGSGGFNDSSQGNSHLRIIRFSIEYRWRAKESLWSVWADDDDSLCREM